MKGTVQSKITKKGTEYLYIYLDYIDPITHKRKQKQFLQAWKPKEINARQRR